MIVDRFLARLEPLVEEHRIPSLDKWSFERTHAKRDPTALKWKLVPPKVRRKHDSKPIKRMRTIASRFTVKELLHSDGYTLVVWEDLLLVSPKNLDTSIAALDSNSLDRIAADAVALSTAYEKGSVRSKEALTSALSLIHRMVLTLKGRTPNADATTTVTPTKPEPPKTGPTLSRTA